MSNHNNALSVSYPIGAIYISTIGIDPKEFFGGQWERLKDAFLLASGDKYSPGLTGGESEHTLTESEMPIHKHNNTINVSANQASHDHVIYSGDGSEAKAAGLGYGYCYAIGGADNDKSTAIARSKTGTGQKLMDTSTPAISVYYTIENELVGNNQSHNNMPPFISVYMWKRIG